MQMVGSSSGGQLKRPAFLALLFLLSTLQKVALVWCGPNGGTAAQADVVQPLSEDGAKMRAKALSHSESLSSLFREPAECAVFAEYGENYLTPIDVLVKGSDTDAACIKAKFALSIKVEEAQFVDSRTGDESNWKVNNQTNRPILGYVPLEHVIRVEESCPAAKKKPAVSQKDPKMATDDTSNDSEKSHGDRNDDKKAPIGPDDDDDKDKKEAEEDENELEMIVTFDCGKLSFTFNRDHEKFYVSAIRGIVKLDQKVVREFAVNRPLFLTSDLDHHFKYDEMIEVVSEVQSKSHILTANFYLTEFEAFRSTTSRDFMKPPDGKSKPFSDETCT